jgi:hypothetical protein
MPEHVDEAGKGALSSAQLDMLFGERAVDRVLRRHRGRMADEHKMTAVAFWIRATAEFASCGIPLRRVLADDGACSVSTTVES